MYEDDFSFEGLEPIEETLIRRADEISYLALKDRTDRRFEDSVGRIDLEPSQLAEFLRDDDEPCDPAEPESARLMRAGLRWVRVAAIRNSWGQTKRSFRLRAYQAKGTRVLESGTFTCRDNSAELDEDRPLAIPAPRTVVGAEQESCVKGMNALGDYYAQWGRIVLGSVGQLQGVNNNMLYAVHRQLRELREQNERLVTSILDSRIQELESRQQALDVAHNVDVRSELAKDALGQLGSAATAFLGAPAADPAGLELLQRLHGSPTLIAAMSEPSVQALMSDPGNLDDLAALLRQLGEAANAPSVTNNEEESR